MSNRILAMQTRMIEEVSMTLLDTEKATMLINNIYKKCSGSKFQVAYLLMCVKHPIYEGKADKWVAEHEHDIHDFDIMSLVLVPGCVHEVMSLQSMLNTLFSSCNDDSEAFNTIYLINQYMKSSGERANKILQIANDDSMLNVAQFMSTAKSDTVIDLVKEFTEFVDEIKVEEF